MIKRADFGIYNLTLFRGANADVGAAFELGLTVRYGKRVLGHTNVADDFLDRCRSWRDARSGH
jgi:nucleoside 2-deoxyribosyltransferase